LGITTSQISTSFENLKIMIPEYCSGITQLKDHLFRILPRGVVSKKDIGLLMILSSIVSCIDCAAFKVYTAKKTVAT
jgi:hypothetical protein